MKKVIKKIKFPLGIVFLAFIFLSITPCSVGYSDPFSQPYTKDDYSYKYGYLDCDKFEAHAKAQGHLVFADGQAGWSTYHLYLRGLNCISWIYPTRIKVNIYISAHYEEKFYPNWRPIPRIRKYWAPAPVDLIEWNGYRDYNAQVPRTVFWSLNIGGSSQGFNMGFGVSYYGHPTSDAASKSGTDGDYRYIGYFASQYLSGEHEFTALLYLDVGNRVANDYYYGLEEWNDDGITVTKITAIKIKLKWTYYYQFFWMWYNRHSYIGDLHDEYNDLSEIILHPGTS